MNGTTRSFATVCLLVVASLACGGPSTTPTTAPPIATPPTQVVAAQSTAGPASTSTPPPSNATATPALPLSTPTPPPSSPTPVPATVVPTRTVPPSTAITVPAMPTGTATPQSTATAPASPTPDAAPTGQPSAPVAVEVEQVAGGLVAPWSLAFAPDGRIFVTERPGRLRVLVNGTLQPEPVAVMSDVAATGEGGLLGMALNPDFGMNGWLYLYYTYRSDGQLRNRVVRYVEANNQLQPETRQVIVDDIPGSGVHNGGRIAFGPDGRLYVTTGDAAVTSLSQDRATLAGKILRVEADGSIPGDNPFPGSPVYSYGHRNPQGLAWQTGTNRLYATEHGPSANDELNLIEPGQNYGWPVGQGRSHPAPFVPPVILYENTVAPSGAAFYDDPAIPQWHGSLFFTALRGTHLHRVVLSDDDPRQVATEERLYDGEFGRLRDVVPGPNGALYLLTSNRDGRGNPMSADDRILRIAPR